MPQVWLTYDEFGDFLGIGADAGRTFAVSRDLSRRVSRDGQTRLKLSPELAETFMIEFVRKLDEKMVESSIPLEGPVEIDLRAVADLLAATRSAGIDLASVLTSLLRDVRAKAGAPTWLPAPIERAG